MDAKILIIFACILQYVCCAGLLRTPKVYNALITTDDNLSPSRAFPIIQPTIHETGIASFPFGLHAYRFVNPPLRSHFGPPGENFLRNAASQYSYGILPKVQPPLELPQNSILESGYGPIDLPPPATNQAPFQAPEGEVRPPFPLPHPIHDNQQPPIPPEAGRPPIPLNEFGLPPSLMPLPSFPRPQNPFNLQPYPFNNYPLVYESFNQIPETYLPPYGYYPPPTGFGNSGPKMESKPVAQPTNLMTKLEEQTNSQTVTSVQGSNDGAPHPDSLKVQASVDGIKNVSVNRNKEVPDVPPPPIPSGAKSV